MATHALGAPRNGGYPAARFPRVRFRRDIGFWYLPSDLAARDAARDLAAHGAQTTVTDVQVHVGRFQGRGAPYYEADEVRVDLPGAGPAMLSGLLEPEETDTRPMRTGWQQPNARTRYMPPLDVVYLRRSDGTVQAMTQVDMQRIANSTDPETGLVLGIGMLVIVGVCVVAGNTATVRRLVGSKDLS